MLRPLRTPASLLGGLAFAGLVWPAADASSSAGGAAAAHQMRACVNAERQRLGMRTLRPSPALIRAARMHARAMASGRAPFDHTDARGRGPAERVRAAGGRPQAVGENIAAGAGNAAAACRMWRSSGGHYANWTLPRFKRIGTAVASGPRGRMYVQVFGSR